jgi:predicted DNA-binding transcriptional regulator AlpA
MDLLTTEQAATKLGLSERTLEAWRSRGEGPPFLRVGPRRVAYTREDLRVWLVRRRHEPARSTPSTDRNAGGAPVA